MLVDQSAALRCHLLDPSSFADDGVRPPEACVVGRDVADALVTAVIVVVVDEVAGRGFEGTRQIVVFEQEAVLQGLVPALEVLSR